MRLNGPDLKQRACDSLSNFNFFEHHDYRDPRVFLGLGLRVACTFCLVCLLSPPMRECIIELAREKKKFKLKKIVR